MILNQTVTATKTKVALPFEAGQKIIVVADASGDDEIIADVAITY
jgi:hypothetical protein